MDFSRVVEDESVYQLGACTGRSTFYLVVFPYGSDRRASYLSAVPRSVTLDPLLARRFSTLQRALDEVAWGLNSNLPGVANASQDQGVVIKARLSPSLLTRAEGTTFVSILDSLANS